MIFSYSNRSDSRGCSWEAVPAAHLGALETVSADVAVIGAGVSGLAAAVRCAQLGLSVIVAEKRMEAVPHGKYIGVVPADADKKIFAKEWLKSCGSRVNEDLLWLYINNSEAAFEWLLGIGGDDVKGNLFGGAYKGPDFTEYYGTHIISRKPGSTRYRYTSGSMLMCEMLQNFCLENGGQIIRNTRVVQLDKEGDRVTGFVAVCEDGKYRRFKASNAVILATGDIGGDPEMLAAFCPLGLKCNVNGYFPAGLNTGDGHKMALWAGAAWQRTWPACAMIQGSRLGSNLPYGSHRGLRVNVRGERYCNEDMNGAYTALTTLREPKGRAFAIWGANYARDIRWRAHGGQRDGPDNTPENVVKNWETQVADGKLMKADTLPELIEKLGLPASTLETIEHYNALCRAGADTDFHKKPEYLQEIREAPFYGGELSDIRFFTVLGGPRTDSRLRVCDADDEPIPGLYCVGSMIGDMYANYYNFRIPGQNYGACLTFGYITGRRLAAE